MLKVNLKDIPEISHQSPKGKYQGFFQGVSIALGRDADATDAKKRHPFDLELVRLPPGASLCPYHVESAQWELYLVISGRGSVRHEGGTTEVLAGDSFIFAPGEAHQLTNSSDQDFTYYVIADNPVGDSCYYPDSNKWGVRIGSKSSILQQQLATYYDGEE